MILGEVLRSVSNLATVRPSQAAPQGQGAAKREGPHRELPTKVAGHVKPRENKFEIFYSYPSSRGKKAQIPSQNFTNSQVIAK